MFVGHLYDNARILGKEDFHDVVSLKAVEVDLQSSPRIGETHFQQGGDEASGADVVSSQNESSADAVLNGIEGIAEVFGRGAAGNVGAHLSLCLGESASSEAEGIEREIDMIEGALRFVGQHGADNLADVRYLASCRNDDGTWSNHFPSVGVFLRHGEAVLACGDIDAEGAAEVRKRLDSCIEACILALLRAAGPHPVSAEADAVEAFCERSPHDICQSLGNGENATCGRIGKSRLRGMSESRSHTVYAAIVEGNHAAVRERELQFTLTLLTGYLACNGTVDFVRQPVFAGHSLKAKHAGKGCFKVFNVLKVLKVLNVGVVMGDGFVNHYCLGRMPEHLRHVQVEGAYAVALLEGKVGISCRLADNIHRGTLALGNTPHVVEVFLFNKQTHTLLALVGNNLLGRECGVADGQLGHVDKSSTLFDKLRQAVDVSG